MNISILDVLGPVMIGPSSSHTAGAARLARCARLIAGKPFTHVSFGLCGSFAKTGLGHGTRQALLAGALGLSEEDDRLRWAEKLAEEAGLGWDFYDSELDGVHENTAEITFTFPDGKTCHVVGCSVGGGRILITGVDGMPVELTGERPALLVRQYDRPGVVGAVTGLLAKEGINIAVMRVTREAKGETAGCVIETDAAIPEGLVEHLAGLANIRSVRAISL